MRNYPPPSKAVTHVGYKSKGPTFNVSEYTTNIASSSDHKAPKSGWRIKKRRHDEGSILQTATIVPTKVKSAEPKQVPQKKENTKGMKESVTLPQASSISRLPLQQSSKQNIIPPSSGSTTSMKGFKSAMHIEQVSPNHFKFTEENRPPDKMTESMEIIEGNEGKTSPSIDTLMQEDSDMDLDLPPPQQSGT